MGQGRNLYPIHFELGGGVRPQTHYGDIRGSGQVTGATDQWWAGTVEVMLAVCSTAARCQAAKCLEQPADFRRYAN